MGEDTWRVMLSSLVWAAVGTLCFTGSQLGFVIQEANFRWQWHSVGAESYFLFGPITILTCGHIVLVVTWSMLSHSKWCEF